MRKTSPFLFVCCQPGAESLLKDELAREHPALRFAFSRPGFVTFKNADQKDFSPNFDLTSVFARAYGVSFGPCQSANALEEVSLFAKQVFEHVKKPLRLHVWERDLYVPGEEPEGYSGGEAARQFESALRPLNAGIFHDNSEASSGDIVINVILLEGSTKSGSPVYLGIHEHSSFHHRYPGGQIQVNMPSDSPSRAYLKMEQAIQWGRVPLKPGDHAIELGSAPGGASYALIRRGLKVCGIDPASMDPLFTQDLQVKAQFRHLRYAFSEIQQSDFLEPAQWLVLDINAPARVSLPYVETLARWNASSLLGVILTLKLNDPKHARHIPEWIQRVEEMGLSRVRATQLPANKREICVVGLNRKALIR